MIAHWVSCKNDNHRCPKSIFLIALLADGFCMGSRLLTAGCLCFFTLSDHIIQYGLQIHHTACTCTPLKRSHGLFFLHCLELLHTGNLALQNLKQLHRKGNRFCTGMEWHFSFDIVEKLPLPSDQMSIPSLHPLCHVKEIKSWQSGSPFRWKIQAVSWNTFQVRASANVLQNDFLYSVGKR